MVVSLPEGLLKTNPEIFSVLARYPVIPTEDMIQCSNVYSTLHQTFDDYTSARAKNFWRRIEGQQLSGPAVAKLFREFLSGQTAVPLRRAKGQDEEPLLVLQTSQQGTSDEVDVKPPKDSNQEIDLKALEEPKEGESLGCSPPITISKPFSSSSSRSVPQRSILKKTRGPSTLEVQYTESTPEPTARPTKARLELEAQRVPQPTPSSVPLQTQTHVGFSPPIESTTTIPSPLLTSPPGGSEKSTTPALPTPPPSRREPSTTREQTPSISQGSNGSSGEQTTSNHGDVSQRKVSFLGHLPGASSPRRQSTRDMSDPDATHRTIPMDRFGPRIGYVPQRVERSGLLLTGRMVNGSAPS